MKQTPPPASVDVSFSSMLNLAVEWWRISSALSASGSAPAGARHGLRRIEDFLKQSGFEVMIMHGRGFDPGLPLKVIDCVDDPKLSPGETIISETISPLVLYDGQVVRQAEVITRRGPE
jgi:hypothetical protein